MSDLTPEQERDTAYRERAQLVALLAALYPSHIGHNDPEAPDWAVVTIESPTGQWSWHVAPADRELFAHVDATPHYARGWDGHSTEEKYERVRELIRKVQSGEEQSVPVVRRRAAPIYVWSYNDQDDDELTGPYGTEELARAEAVEEYVGNHIRPERIGTLSWSMRENTPACYDLMEDGKSVGIHLWRQEVLTGPVTPDADR